MSAVEIRCAECSAKGATRCYRLNPRNWRQEFRLLCTRCRKQLGFASQQYDRTYSETNAPFPSRALGSG